MTLCIPSAHASRTRPTTLSSTSHNSEAKAAKHDLRARGGCCVHPPQRGFMLGRSMRRNVFDALAPRRIALYPGDSSC